MATVRAGSYSHRFQGNARDRMGTPYFLAGVGTMILTGSGDSLSLAGRQESVTLPIQGWGGGVVNTAYDLVGTVTKQSTQALWDAEITFTQADAVPPIIMKATFVLTPADRPDAYWSISTGGEIVQGPNAVPTEAVAGEIVRTGD